MKMFNSSDIKKEYNTSSQTTDKEYEKVKWGSEASMINRFKLAESLVDFKHLDKVLDVGCGTGTFIRYLLKSYNFHRIKGIDISDNLIEYCNTNRVKNEEFTCTDLLDLDNEEQFDFISLIGVLQKTNHEVSIIFNKLHTLLTPHGIVFLTTKNIMWDKFTTGELSPETDHNWFVPQEIEQSILDSGFFIIQVNGFIPADNQIVPFNQSHSFFILAGKK